MTPEERKAAMERFGYRSPVRPEDWPMFGPMLVMPFGLAAGAVAAFSSGGATGWLAGAGFAAAAAAVGSWAWSFFKKPTAPDDDAEFEREIRYRMEDERRA